MSAALGTRRRLATLACVACVALALSLIGGLPSASGGPSSGFRSATSATASGASLTLARPAGVAANDLLVAVIDVLANPTVTAPSGWTLARSDTIASGTHMRQALYTRVATAAEAGAYTWTFSTADPAAGAVADYVGVQVANAVDATSGQTTVNGTTLTAPSVTTTAANDILVAAFAISDTGTLSAPTGMTQRVSVSLAGQPGTRVTDDVADAGLGAAGSTGTRTVKLAASASGIGELLALRTDTTPPSTPSNLTQSGGSQASVTVQWGASTDNVGVAGYTVYLNGTSVTTTSSTSYSVTGLVCGTNYQVGVDAFDAAGNHPPRRRSRPPPPAVRTRRRRPRRRT